MLFLVLKFQEISFCFPSRFEGLPYGIWRNSLIRIEGYEYYWICEHLHRIFFLGKLIWRFHNVDGMSEVSDSILLSWELMMWLLSLMLPFHFGEVEVVVQSWMRNLFSLLFWRRNRPIHFLNFQLIDGWLWFLMTFFDIEVVHVVLVFQLKNFSQFLLTKQYLFLSSVLIDDACKILNKSFFLR